MPEQTPDIMAEAITDFHAAGLALRKAVRAERDYEFRRPVEKDRAIRSLVGSIDPDTGKAHSATSAEKACESVAAYEAFRREQTDAVIARMVAEEAHFTARIGLEYSMRRAVQMQEPIAAGVET